MRKTIDEQLRLVPASFDHHHVRELQAMSATLDCLPEAATLILGDLTGAGIDPSKGREGMSAEQVLRALIIKQMTGFSYETLAFHLGDSATYRAFCHIGIADTPPSRSTLQRNIKSISAETLESINKKLVEHAAREGLEDGRRVRTDSTVVNAAIHPPSDASLLWDCIRVLTRLLYRARRWVKVSFTDHRRRAKRRLLAIRQRATKEQRASLYQDLLKVVRSTVRAAEHAVEALQRVRRGRRSNADARELAVEMQDVILLSARVMEQTRRRVHLGESVPARDKIVSIFEPHVDVIVKDHRETFYGHKICLTAGASGLVLDLVVLEGNSADATLTVPMMQRQVELYGRPPQQACFDGAFSSIANLQQLKQLGIIDVAYPTRRLQSASMRRRWLLLPPAKRRRHQWSRPCSLNLGLKAYHPSEVQWESLCASRKSRHSAGIEASAPFLYRVGMPKSTPPPSSASAPLSILGSRTTRAAFTLVAISLAVVLGALLFVLLRDPPEIPRAKPSPSASPSASAP